jgi:hypothetical protein
LQKPYNFKKVTQPTRASLFCFFLAVRLQCPFSRPPTPGKCAYIKPQSQSSSATGQQQQPAGSSPVKGCPSVTPDHTHKRICDMSLPGMNAKTNRRSENHLHMSIKYQAEAPITTRTEEHAFFTLPQHATGTKKYSTKIEVKSRGQGINETHQISRAAWRTSSQCWISMKDRQKALEPRLESKIPLNTI